MSSKLLGKCACEKVRYEIKGEPLVTQACHCEDCQRTTGAAFVIHAVVCEEDFHITGDTHMGIGPTGSGTGCELHACVSCGVMIWVRYLYHKVPVIAVRVGTLEDPSALTPQAHIFTSRKVAWLSIPDDVPSFAQGIDRSKVWPQESIDRYDSLLALKPSKT
ncbi:MAG: GFA family protein [Pseudomonadota bacterium]